MTTDHLPTSQFPESVIKDVTESEESGLILDQSFSKFMSVESATFGDFEFEQSLDEAKNVDNFSFSEFKDTDRKSISYDFQVVIDNSESNMNNKFKDVSDNFLLDFTSETHHSLPVNISNLSSSKIHAIDSNMKDKSEIKKSYGIRKTEITKSGFVSSMKNNDSGTTSDKSFKRVSSKSETSGVILNSSLRSNSSSVSKFQSLSNKSNVSRPQTTKTSRSSIESKTLLQNNYVSHQIKNLGTKPNNMKSKNILRSKFDAESKDVRTFNSSKKISRNTLSSSTTTFDNAKSESKSTSVSQSQSTSQSFTKTSSIRHGSNIENKNSQLFRGSYKSITSSKLSDPTKILKESSVKLISSTTNNKSVSSEKSYTKVDSKSLVSNTLISNKHSFTSQEKSSKKDHKPLTMNQTPNKKSMVPEMEKHRKTNVNEILKKKQVSDIPESTSKPRLKSYMLSTESRNLKLKATSHTQNKSSAISTNYQRERVVSDTKKKLPTSPSRIPIKDNSSISVKTNLSLLNTKSIRSSSVPDPRILSAPSQRSGFDFTSSPRKLSPTSLPASPAHRCFKADKKISSVLITSEVFSSSSDRASSVELVYKQPTRSPSSSMSEQQPTSITESVSLEDDETTHSSNSDTNRDSEINTNIFDSSINWNLALRKSYQFSVIDIMSEESKNNVPQIAITAYEFNEDDIEVTNLFNATHEKNMNTYEPRSVSPNITKQKSKIILKSPITNSLSKSLSPVLSDFNNLTDTEVISDSDDEKYYIRSPNLSPGLINYFILTDVEDLSEDEEHEKNSKVNEEHTDTENFTGDKEIFNEMGQTEKYLESASYFQQPHKEIIFHSKDGNVRSLTPTEESNPIWLKTPNEEVKGFDSEEEIITADECGEQESYLKNNNTYYHDIDVGVVDSVESIKHEQCKHKYRNRLLVTKKNVMQESEFGKKRFRHKNRSNSEIIESSEKPPEEFKKKILSKYTSEPTLNKIKIPKQNQNIEQNRIKHQKTNNKFVIHDNKNDISISIDFESNNSVLLNVGRHFGNLSMRWCNNEIMTGDEVNHTKQQNAKSINNSERSPELTTNANNIVLQNSVDKIPPIPNPRHSIESSITSSIDEDDIDYSTKKQFWEEIAKTNQPPLPKPRYSISLPIQSSEQSVMKNSSLELIENSFSASDNAEIPEMIKKSMTSNQTTKNLVVSELTCQKSESLNKHPHTPLLEEKNSKEIKRLDSETEYINKYGEESLAFENEGYQEDVFEDKLPSKKEYSRSSNKIKLDPKTRSMSLPSHQVQPISSKEYFQQIKPQMEGIQMEQESSPEHKSLKNTTHQQSPSQEDLINRQIHKHIFSNELDEQIDSLIPEEKYLDLKGEKSVSINSLQNTLSDKISCSTSEKSLTKTESAESYVLDDFLEEKINKVISKQSKEKNSSSLTQDQIDEIPSDTYSLAEEKEKSTILSESIDSSMIDDELHNENYNASVNENEKGACSPNLRDHIIHTPEEHIPDTIWEVTQLGTDEQELENIEIKDQCLFQQNYIEKVNSLESLKTTEKEITRELARSVAEQLINEIEIELTKRHDVLANLHHLMMSPDQFKQLENSGYLDMEGEDLKLKIMESVLAKKSRDQLKNISKHDTITSSIEITDEDLKSSGFEIEYDTTLSKTRLLDHSIPEYNFNKSEKYYSTTNSNSNEFEKSSRDEKEEYFKVAEDNLIVETYIKEQQNENKTRKESQKKDMLSNGQVEHQSKHDKFYQDTKTDVFEKMIIKENDQKIETQEFGSHFNSKDDSNIHDVIYSNEILETKNGSIFNEGITKYDSHETHNKDTFVVENKQNKNGKNTYVETNEKHFDTCSKDFKDELIKKEQYFEQKTDGGLEICGIEKEQYREKSCIIKETVDNYKNEITLIKDSEPGSSKSLTKQLSAESFPSKDNSVHSPTSPSSSSIDIREEKHVNFDTVILRKPNSTNTNKLTTKRPADSSSSESHYHSFDHTSSSRPCSSDVDGLLAGSSEYESAISVPSNEYHTAISSLSSRESMKSLDSESSGNLASVENSEASETLVASTGDLDFDQEGTNSILEDEDKIEPYEQEIPMHIIRGESLPIIAELTEMKYNSMYKTQPFSQPTINSEKNIQKMKRSHEMTFHPIPKHITSDSLSDSSSHEEKLFSSEDASMSISSTEGQAIQTVVEAINGFPESGTCSLSLSEENTKSVETLTTRNGYGQNNDQCNVTIISSTVTNGKHQNVCTQMTTKSEEPQKKGHRRNSSSINKIVVEELDITDKKDPSKECTLPTQHLEYNQDISNQSNVNNTLSKEIYISDLETKISTEHDKYDHEIHGSQLSDKHSFEHIDDIAEADAAFQMVPHVSPAIPNSLPPTIPEDPFSEDEDDLQDDSIDVVPNIMITEHMAPLVDRGFHYPDLDLEAKELEIKSSTPQTPASISSKNSSDTDQGREYIINEDYDPHEEPSWTGEDHTVLENVEETEEKESVSMSESFELIDNIEEKLDNSEDEFVVIEEIAREAKEEDSEGKAITIEGKIIKNHKIVSNIDSSTHESESESPDSKGRFELEYTNQKWVELQFEDDNTINEVYGYNIEYERPPLEDIKEEDTDDLQSSKVGSMGSQVSHSIDSIGSMKESFSSTPESKKYLGKSLENDNISVNSLQEFERLEQLIRIESMKAKSSGSLASTTSSSNSKKDDLSLASLKDFETIEAACFKTELIENKALATERSLTGEDNTFKINEIIREAEINLEQNDDNSEKHKSEDDNLTSTESLDLKTIVTDMKVSTSLEQMSCTSFVEGKQHDYDDCMNSSVSSRGFSSPIMDDHSKESSYRNSLILGSNDSLGPISSTSTNATYHCETGSNMSSSFTSGGSNTMVSSMEGLDKTGGKHDWFDEHETFESHKKETDGTEFTHKLIRLPAEIHKITARGPDKEKIIENYVEQFSSGEFQEEMEHTDERGNVFVTRIVQKRMVFDSEESASKGVSEDELNKCLRKLSKDEPDGFEISKKTSTQIAGSSEDTQAPSTSNEKKELQVAAPKPELKCEISMDDDTEIDLREHDWRFQHQINTETDDITKPSTSGWTGKSKPKENVSEL
ncbi:uncharacterized protein LOC112690430 [Sipha flava]|uniref:Uncharacterized protein LOC112690430 n=1 Tax=Sipha flava TaxID=143950 RepID=A0A8B8GC94_9HEMI|nr:uncharacterized protein LOC112690430 [Sipha flava]